MLVWRAFANNRAVTERRLLDSARVDAAALDREFATIESTLRALSTSPTLQGDDLRGFYDEARRIQSLQSGWYSIVLSSPDGQQRVSTRLPWGTELGTEIELESVNRLVATRQPTVGVVWTTSDGAPEYVCAIRYRSSKTVCCNTHCRQ